MLLVLFFLLVIFSAIISLKIRINFKDIQISNINENNERTKLKHNYNIQIEFIILECIKIFKIKFNNQKMNKILNRVEHKIKEINVEREIKKDIKNRRALFIFFKNLKLKLDEFNLNIQIGTEGIVSTIGIFTVISTIIPIIIRNNASKVKYNVKPIYNTGNVINLWANGITEVYLVHIIYALYTIGKQLPFAIVKPRLKSNRRATSTLK